MTLTYAQLLDAGWTPQRMRTAVARGELTRVRRGSYAYGPAGWRGRLGAVQAAHPAAVASHLTAACLWGFAESGSHVTVSAPHGATIRSETGVRVHRTARPLPSTVRSGFVVTTAVRTVLDLSRTSEHVTGVCLADAALAAGVCRRVDLVADVADTHHLRHAAEARRVVAACREGAQSPMETRVRLAVVGAGLPEPTLQHPVFTAHATYHLDLAWPEAKVCIEYDGVAHHSGAAAFARDRRRWRVLSAEGWDVHPISSMDMADLRRLTSAMQAALVRRGVRVRSS